MQQDIGRLGVGGERNNSDSDRYTCSGDYEGIFKVVIYICEKN